MEHKTTKNAVAMDKNNSMFPIALITYLYNHNDNILWIDILANSSQFKAVLCFIKHARCEVAQDLRIDWRYTVGIERPYNILKFKDDVPNFFSHSDRSSSPLNILTHMGFFLRNLL